MTTDVNGHASAQTTARPAGRSVAWFGAMLVVGAAAYAWLAEALWSSVRDQSWAWSAFLGVHLLVTGCSVATAASRGSLAVRVVLVVVTLAVSVYLLMLVWFNVWGT
jgi:hypothetical protein